jgi:hypothetical protein
LEITSSAIKKQRPWTADELVFLESGATSASTSLFRPGDTATHRSLI